jgi:transcription antitermination protein NusB
MFFNMKTEETQEIFPLSKKKFVKGSRRLAREKALQIINAYTISGISWAQSFGHVFSREFNFGEEEEEENKKEPKSTRILRQEEVIELESDIPIKWKQDEIDFTHRLIKETIELAPRIDLLIEEYADNWELERIALLDRILMQIAITELMRFPEIPPKVSINEAIDIAKKYSTHKSSNFINGVLDSVNDKLQKDGKISKTGRGLK